MKNLKKTKTQMIKEKEACIEKSKEFGTFWSWCEKCYLKIDKERDSYKFDKSSPSCYENDDRRSHYSFDICKKCYDESFKFLEECMVCEVCKEDLVYREKMIQETTRVYCSEKCYRTTFAVWEDKEAQKRFNENVLGYVDEEHENSVY